MKKAVRTVNIHEAKTHIAGEISVPDDFDTMGADEILTMFGLDD